MKGQQHENADHDLDVGPDRLCRWPLPLRAIEPPAVTQTSEPQTGTWGDQGDGTYRNPSLGKLDNTLFTTHPWSKHLHIHTLLPTSELLETVEH